VRDGLTDQGGDFWLSGPLHHLKGRVVASQRNRDDKDDKIASNRSRLVASRKLASARDAFLIRRVYV